MNETPASATDLRQPARPAEAPRRGGGLASLLRLLATWSERMRLRRQLEHRLRCAPHLIDDIGLTRGEAEAEIAKPFWRG